MTHKPESSHPAAKPANIRESYDVVARAYADEIYGELKGKPFDRELLDRFASQVRGNGRAWRHAAYPFTESTRQ